MIALFGLLFWGLIFVLTWYLFLKFIIGIFVKDKTKLIVYRNIYFLFVMFAGGLLAFIEDYEKNEAYEERLAKEEIEEKTLIFYPKYDGENEQEPFEINDWSRLEDKKNIDLYFNSQEYKKFKEIDAGETTHKLMSEFMESRNIETLRKHIQIEISDDFLREKTINELKKIRRLQSSAENILQSFEYFMSNQTVREKGFKSQSQLSRALSYGIKNYDELLNESKKWQEEFLFLKTSCGGVIPEVKGYGPYMTTKQLILTSIVNDENLSCGRGFGSDPYNLETRCTSSKGSETINEFYLSKISENGPYRVFQLRIGFGGKLKSAEQEVVAENFKKKYKTNGWSKFCKDKPTQIDNISIITSPSIGWNPGENFMKVPRGNYIEIFAGEVVDAQTNLWYKLDEKKHQIEKSKAQQKESLKKF